MSDNYESFDRTESFVHHTAIIKVIGVGNGGINAVAGMLSKLKSVEFWAIDTDIETLAQTPIPNRLTLGDKSEWHESIARAIEGADLVCIVAEMGGEQGIDAMMAIAEVSREMGALTLGVVTLPFSFEGIVRANRAIVGIDKLVNLVDTLITISNDKFLIESDNSISNQAAFLLADNMMLASVRPLIDLITLSGIIGVDFADARAVLADAGLAYFGIGKSDGKSRAKDAALQAINSPLLQGSIERAKAAFFVIYGGDDMTLREVHAAAETIYEVVDPNVNIIYQAVIDPSMEGKMQVSIIATGFTNIQ